MMTDCNSPCELILKIGCNEYDEISTAITSLLRSCSINDEKFFFVERQIQPTTYFGSFTNQLSPLKTPIQCQSISCIIFLPDKLFQEQEKKDFFKSIHLWNFHHKIELLNEYKQIIARQDYYELSQYLPLWSISHIPYNKQIIIRFNIFTNNFDLMVKFYQDLFQRTPDSSKIGFVLFNLSTKKIFYQFSIKYSPLIQSYTISQSAYLKFRLNNLNFFLHEYTSKLFTINKFEYYIYDPDGNLLHLYNISSNKKEYIKPLIHTNDSGFGDSSEPSIQLFHSNLSQIYIDEQNHSSNDSGQCSSISSNELYKVNNISVRSANKNEIDYRLKQQQRTVFPRISRKQQECKLSLYDSEPRLSNIISYNNRYYSSMNNIQKFNQIRSSSINHFNSSILKSSSENDNDISYDVDYPPIQSKISSFGYLNAFLLKKQQQNIKILTSRPKSAPLSLRSKSVNDTSSTDDEKLNNPIDEIRNSRINIGITLDSRLRKTPVFDMLRSTTMQSDIIEPQRLNRTYSLRHSFVPIARF